ncbi:MAG: Paired box protein Pax-5 [Paramarteilia canceri]
MGGIYTNGKPLPLLLRHQIIFMANRGFKASEISKELKVSHGCISKIINKYIKTGSILPGEIGGSKPKVATVEVVAAIASMKAKSPTLFAWEIRDKLIESRICTPQNVPSVSSINRVIRHEAASNSASNYANKASKNGYINGILRKNEKPRQYLYPQEEYKMNFLLSQQQQVQQQMAMSSILQQKYDISKQNLIISQSNDRYDLHNIQQQPQVPTFSPQHRYDQYNHFQPWNDPQYAQMPSNQVMFYKQQNHSHQQVIDPSNQHFNDIFEDGSIANTHNKNFNPKMLQKSLEQPSQAITEEENCNSLQNSFFYQLRDEISPSAISVQSSTTFSSQDCLASHMKSDNMVVFENSAKENNATSNERRTLRN